MEKKFDFYLSYNCSSACVFCSSADKMRRYGKEGSLSWDVIRNLLIEKWRKGYRVVVFTGGEPSESKHLLPALRLARRLGYRISVNTNLARFAKREFACEALPLVDEIVASVHGHTAQLHDSIVSEAGSFERFLCGMANVGDLGRPDTPYVLTDTVLVRSNLPYVREIIHFASGFPKVRHLLISNVNLPPELKNRSSEVVPRLTELKGALPAIVEEAEKRNVVLRFYGIPVCILNGFKIHSSDFYYEPKITIERYRTADGVLNRERDASKPLARSQTPKCRKCDYVSLCGGIFDSYLELHGDEEIEPIH